MSLRFVLRSWASVRGIELLVVVLLVLLLMAERLGAWLDFSASTSAGGSMALQPLLLCLQGLILLLFWLPAARSAAPPSRRTLRLVLALLLGVLAGALLMRTPLPAAWANAWHLSLCDACGRELQGHKPWLESFSEALTLLLVAGLTAAVAELRRRQQHNVEQLQQVLDEQARLRREAAAARWAARAARVDPQQLLAALEAVEGLIVSPTGAAHAGLELERLMGTLRQALQPSPRHPS